MKLLSTAVLLATLLLSQTLAAPLSPANVLEKRSTKCKSVSSCKKVKIPSHSSHKCSKKVCTWSCNSGYTSKSGKCVKKTVAKKKAATSSTSSAVSEGVLGSVKAFTGTNTGSIMSWYQTNSARDSTNGHSWCYYPYQDSTPGFAISLAVMKAAAGGDEFAARKMFCGLEAVLTNPETGKTVTLYVADAFAEPRTSTSVDIILPAFEKLYGSDTNDKNVVIKSGTWKFTGRRSAQYSYASSGN